MRHTASLRCSEPLVLLS